MSRPDPLTELIIAVRKVLRLSRAKNYSAAKVDDAIDEMRAANSRYKKDRNTRARQARENMRDLLDRAHEVGLK